MEMLRCMCMLTGSGRLADITRYASDSLRMLRNNLNTPDYIKKVDAFFEYAKHDPDQRRQNLDVSKTKYAEVDHVAEFLKREYYVE